MAGSIFNDAYNAPDLARLQTFLEQYSFDDLAKSFFILDLWLLNIASPFKMQYLYVFLEAIHNELPAHNKLIDYQTFKYFCERLIPLLPSFVMYEDYVPETDWGEIKYYFEEEFYKVFYGGDLSNSYDFYHAFEITHRPFENEYQNLVSRSAMEEMRFCLESQDYILKNLEQDNSAEYDIAPGDISIPSEDFWNRSIAFIEQFSPQNLFNNHVLTLYTQELIEQNPIPSMDEFESNAYSGRNCQYFYLRKGGSHYPVLPRRWLTVLYDNWGQILKENFSEISKSLGTKRPNILIGIELAKFIQERIDEDQVFRLAAPVREDSTFLNDLIFTAVRSKDKIILIYVTPPIFNDTDLGNHLDEIKDKLIECQDVLVKGPTRLHLAVERRVVGFRSSEGNETLSPIFLAAVPSLFSSIMGTIRIPEGVDMEVTTLDQVAGIFDEIENADELSDFLDYLSKEREINRVFGPTSYLDRFGSFKDSHGILVPGAIEPNMIMLDFSWGSNYRYNNLRKFWEKFPEIAFWGHPRSWLIAPERSTETGCILKSKSYFGYYYHQSIGTASIFINAPVHLLSYREGSFADSIIHSLYDAIDLYQEILKTLNLSKTRTIVQVFFFPSSAVEQNNELKHVRHLIQKEDLWASDSARIGLNRIGIRVVYNEEKIIETLQKTQDRSVQVSLLIAVLQQLSEVAPEQNLKDIVTELEKERSKKVRFGVYEVEKRASFPEGISKILPDIKEYKGADKEIAKLALELNINPGKYTSAEAKTKLNELRSKLVKTINAKVSDYDFQSTLPILIEKLNALMHDSWRTEEDIKASLNHEVDYERNERSSEKEKELIHWSRVYRYLIEKFVQLKPAGKNKINESQLKELLAFTDRLLELYSSSDFINYQIYPVHVIINDDYLVTIADETNDIAQMEKEYGDQQAKISLGLIGNKSDTADADIPVHEYLDELDEAFKKDFGFGLKNLVNVLQVLALWAAFAKKDERTFYHASSDEIATVCINEINGFDPAELKQILEFLTLRSEELLYIKNLAVPQNDLPVWEHTKRLMRYDLRPLVNIDDLYYWGPYSAERTARIWIGISNKHKLPSDFDAPTVKDVLKKGHINLEGNLVKKIKEITLRHTPLVETDVFPHKMDKSVNDIGDYDVLGYLKSKNILLNIESKIIDPSHSAKDSGRMQRTVFGYTNEEGKFRKGYLQKVEERDAYLQAQGKDLITKLGWGTPISSPAVVSIFVTRIGFWWTMNVPVTTKVNFVEIRLLDDFIKNL